MHLQSLPRKKEGGRDTRDCILSQAVMIIAAPRIVEVDGGDGLFDLIVYQVQRTLDQQLDRGPPNRATVALRFNSGRAI